MELFHTHVSEKAIHFATETLRSGRLSEGQMVARFERALSEQLGLVNPVAVNSGTSALHLALVLAGVKSGDEVILPAQTFVATGMAILFAGAIPVFADVDPLTGNISPKSIQNVISLKSRAVLAVHWSGRVCEMDAIQDIANEHALVVVEDAAHALGATYKGKPIGSISDYTCFSFQSTKHLTSGGDGGAVCCNYTLDGEDREQAKALRWFGFDRKAPTGLLGERLFKLDEVGYKYHMSDLSASVGLGNLEGFKERLNRRKMIAGLYCMGLECTCGLRNHYDASSSFYTFPILVEDRNNFCRAMKDRGIPVSIVCSRIDKNPIFGGLRDLPGTAEFDAKQINLPCHEALTEDDVNQVISAIKMGW